MIVISDNTKEIKHSFRFIRTNEPSNTYKIFGYATNNNQHR